MLEILHLDLRFLDPPVEQGHLLALLSESPVYRLELREKSGLALSRVGGLGPRVEESGIGLIAGYAFSAPYEDVKLKSR